MEKVKKKKSMRLLGVGVGGPFHATKKRFDSRCWNLDGYLLVLCSLSLVLVFRKKHFWEKETKEEEFLVSGLSCRRRVTLTSA